MIRTAVSVRIIAGAPVAFVDHARAERPGVDQGQRDFFGNRRQERRAATDNDRIAKHPQLIDQGELDTAAASARPQLITPKRRTTIAMTFTLEPDTELSYLLQSALALPSNPSRDNTHRPGRSKRSYDRCRRRNEISEANDRRYKGGAEQQPLTRNRRVTLLGTPASRVGRRHTPSRHGPPRSPSRP